MSRARSGDKRRWLASAALSAVLVTAVAALFRLPAPAEPVSRPAGLPPVTLIPGRPDELAMRDLVPLFLPTAYNAPSRPLLPLEPGRGYFDVDPGTRLKYSPDAPGLALPPMVRPPPDPVAALANPPTPLARGLGHTDLEVAAHPPTGGRVDVYAASQTNSVLALPLPPGARPVLNGIPAAGWKPLEFVATVDEAGLVGTPVLTVGSGLEQIDTHFRHFLAGEFRLGDRLAPGFYRIVVGP